MGADSELVIFEKQIEKLFVGSNPIKLMEHSISIENSGDEISAQISDLKFSFYKSGDLAGKFTVSSRSLELNRVGPALLVYQEETMNVLKPIVVGPSDVEFLSEKFKDELGSGDVIILKMVFGENGLNSTIKIKADYLIKLYHDENRPAIRFSFRLIDWEASDGIALYGYAPIYSVNENGRLLLSKSLKSEDIRFYSNGYQSWSINNLYHNGFKYRNGKIRYSNICLFNHDDRLGGDFMAEMVSVITDVSERSSLLLGFTTNAKQYTRILMDSLDSNGLLKKLITICQTDSIPLSMLSEELKSSEELLVEFAVQNKGYQLLENWANETGKKMNALVSESKKPLAGWCSWYYYYTKIIEQQMVENVEFFKTHKDFPLDLVQLDDGYQKSVGDFLTLNEKFPKSIESGNGLGWLTEVIHESGKLAGLWIAPFFALKESKLFIEHPDYFIKDKKGNFLKTHYNVMWGGELYGLDLSKDEVVQYVKNHARYISEKWNFDFLKIDFIFASEVLESDYAVKGFTRAQILRRGVEAIRRGFGKDKIILGCGAPLGPCIGLVDVMRIGTDTAANWVSFEFLSRFANTNVPALKPALLATLNRAYMHNTLWINDPDCVVVRENKSKLTIPEIQTELTIFGLSGGQVFYSDDMTLLSEERIHYAKLLTPIHRASAVTTDLLCNYPPKYFSESETTPFGDFTIAAVINWDGAKKEILKLSEIMDIRFSSKYSEHQKFAIFEYWTKKFLGVHSLEEEFMSPKIEKHGVLYLSIVPVQSEQIDSPIFLSSTLHIKQGLAEIKSFSKEKGRIKIELELAGVHQGSLFFLVPSRMEMRSDSAAVKTYDVLNGRISEVSITLNEKATIILNF